MTTLLWIIGSIILIVFLFVVYALCKVAAAADKAEEFMSDKL